MSCCLIRCPGAKFDVLYNGSKPIIADTGSQVRTRLLEVKEVVTEFTLDSTLDEVFIPDLKSKLARLYGVRTSELMVALKGGSVLVSVRLETTAGSLESLLAAVHAVNESSIAAELGINVLSLTSPAIATRNVTTMEQAACPRGHWW